MIDFHLHARRRRGFLDEVLKAYDRVGISRAVLFGLGDDLGEMDNDEVLGACRRTGDRLIPFAYLELGRDGPRTVRTHADAGFAGLKAIWPAAPYDDERFWPVYAEAQELGLPILFHTGIVLRSGRDERRPVSSLWMRPAALDLVARRFPRLRIVAAHLGAPWFDEAFMMARVHPNLWLDVSSGSGWKPKGMGAGYFRGKLGWWDGFGKLVFGVDLPHTRHNPGTAAREWKSILAGAKVPPAEKRKFWSGNAEEILGFTAETQRRREKKR